MTVVPARPASPMRRRLLLVGDLDNLGDALLAEVEADQLAHPGPAGTARPGRRCARPSPALAGRSPTPLYLVHAHVGYMLLSHLATPERVVSATLATIVLVLAAACFIHLVIERRLRPLWQALFTSTLGRLPGHASTSLTRWAGSRT